MVARASSRDGEGAHGRRSPASTSCSNAMILHAWRTSCGTRGKRRTPVRVHHKKLYSGAILQAVEHGGQARGADAHRRELGVVADEAHRVRSEGVVQGHRHRSDARHRAHRHHSVQ